MADGVRRNAYMVSSAIASAARNAASSANGYYNNFYSSGYYMASGFAAGISGGAYKSKVAARAMADAAVKAANNALGIHSPSRVMYKVGQYTVMGFVNALNNNAKSVQEASIGIAKSAENGIASAMSAIGNVLSGDLNVEPVIAPVVDMSNAKDGLQSLNSLLNPITGTRLGEITANINERIGRLDIRDRNSQTSNADIVTAINQLESAMYNMQVVMDTGTTVGVLENGMDRRLGMKALYKDRWN